MRLSMRRRVVVIGFVFLCLTSAAPADAQRTSVGREFPVYDNGGRPDLTMDPKRFVSQMEIVDRYFDPIDDACAFVEGVIGGAGYRRLLRFDTVVLNAGDADLVVGDRSDPDNPYAPAFEFSPCHGHYHIKDFSEYSLLRPNGTVAAVGHKQGFCFEDSLKYGDNRSSGFDCSFQGITSGWGDWYYKQLSGQWIDITGVPEGDYIVRATINMVKTFDEGTDLYPDTIEVRIHVPDPRKKVTIVE
ncbi:MAG TPA: lysyl oxidase family protein [Vicinamibacterales bacterium]|nr:lysyl oxidase family protein [Vicinamibacterales bacterium]